MATKKTKTPTIEELARMRPNAKGGIYMVAPMQTGYRYMPRLGRHGVHCDGDPQLFEKESDALDAAKKFLSQIRTGIVKKIGALN